MIDFPSPILSVASDVVEQLEGQDALRGMWTVFTKCKASLEDGRRLENLSWRLWYQEMASSQGVSPHSPGSVSPPLSETRSVSPITPISEDGPTESHDESSRDSLVLPTNPHARHSWHGEKAALPASGATRRLSTASMPARPHSKSSAPHRVGKMIIEILPDKLVVPPPTSNPPARKPHENSASCTDSSVPTLTNNTPHTIAQPRPLVPLPTMQLPSCDTAVPPAFPRVIVVNPTPHPTPPATPHLPQAVTEFPAGPASTYLLPPQTGRPLFYTHNSSSSSSSSSSALSKPETTETLPTQVEVQQQLKSGGSLSNPDDRTLKPSDRRRLLKHTGSPERHSPDVAPSSQKEQSVGKSIDAPAPSPSSGTSSHMKSDGVGNKTSTRRATGKGVNRRNKEIVRHGPSRAAASRAMAQRQLAQRKNAHGEPKKAAFNIGLASANGGSKAVAITAKAPNGQRDQVVPRPRAPSPAKNVGVQQTKNRAPSKGNPAANGTGAPSSRRNSAMGTESEYETEDSEDEHESEWASDDNSADEKAVALQQKEAARLRQAAEEAQRQRDMFAKVPKRSYSNLNRSQSGLLSQLLNPDPSVFPPGHPYRPNAAQRQQGRPPGPPAMTTKSSVAMPLPAQVIAQAPRGPPLQCYRPKGQPLGQEMEDDSDSENPDNVIPVSESLAQQKLAALADPNRRRQADARSRASQLPNQPPPQMIRPGLPTVATAPIPLCHPYNLPAPAPPMSPRTTRRQMLATELSESLRRNLLWERQISKVNLMAGARRGGVLGSGLRPLTAANPQNGAPSGSGSRQPNNQNPEVNDKEARRRAAIARNRSWADDYHFAGW